MLADEIDAGNIRAVLNLGGSLVTAFPDADTLVPALKKLDVLATLDIIGNETTALSTHVLATKDQLERPDVTMWDFLLPVVAAQHTPAVVDAIGDRRSSWWVLAELGRRLGYQLADTTDGHATDDAMVAAVTVGARVSFDELVDKGSAQVGHELPAPWVDRHVERLGGWRLAPQLLVDQLAVLAEPAPLVLTPRRQRSQLNSQFDYLGEPSEVLIHPEDATAAGVIDGQPVTVRSAQRSTHRGRKGRRRPFGGEWCRYRTAIPRRGTSTVLPIKNDIDLITGMAHYSGVPVSVHPGRATS